MGKFVVDGFEVVKIEHHGIKPAVTSEVTLLEDLVELIAVVNAGELVDIDALVLKGDNYWCESNGKAYRQKGDSVDLHLYEITHKDRCQELGDREVPQRRIAQLADNVVGITVQDQDEAAHDEEHVVITPVINVMIVYIEYDRDKEIYYKQWYLDNAQQPKEDHVQSCRLAVNVFDYKIDDTDAYYDVIQIEICVAGLQDYVIAESGLAVKSEN